LMNGDYKVPSLVIQPFVENAIHHGLLNKLQGERNLSIQILLEQDHIRYIVTDNGVGRTRARELKQINRPEHVSYGIQMSIERVHLFNQNGRTSDVIISDLMQNNEPAGTRIEVIIKIPDSK
jgi:sensor histidine kinase YesM